MASQNTVLNVFRSDGRNVLIPSVPAAARMPVARVLACLLEAKASRSPWRPPLKDQAH